MFQVYIENTSIASYANEEIDGQPNSRDEEKGWMDLRIFSSLPNGIGTPLRIVLLHQIDPTLVKVVSKTGSNIAILLKSVLTSSE